MTLDSSNALGSRNILALVTIVQIGEEYCDMTSVDAQSVPTSFRVRSPKAVPQRARSRLKPRIAAAMGSHFHADSRAVPRESCATAIVSFATLAHATREHAERCPP